MAGGGDGVTDRRFYYSWNDVELALDAARDRGELSADWVSMDVSPRLLYIEISADSSREDDVDIAWSELEKMFPKRADQKNGCLILDVGVLPVEFDLVPGVAKKQRPFRPLFGQGTASIKYEIKNPNGMHAPKVIGFYSYKGGVGRTLSLLRLARALPSVIGMDKKLLFVDADLEAPGLTWLARKTGGFTEFGLLDALAITYSSSNWKEDAVPFIVEKIKSETWRFPVNNRITEHYFLPAFRDESQLVKPPIRPDQMLHPKGYQWIVTDMLLAVAAGLEVPVVLVDLRAGISELSAPIIFDPRVRRVIVTTTSMQSVEGTRFVLKEIQKRHLEKEIGGDPSVIISMVPDDNMELAESIRESLQLQYDDTQIGTRQDNVRESEFSSSPLSVWTLPFSSGLVHIGDIEDIDKKISKLSESTLEQVASDLLLEAYEASAVNGDQIKSSQVNFLLRSIIDFCKPYAEGNKVSEFLKTAPLRSLARKYAFELPRAVVMAAKGGGKTFTYLQFLRLKSWNEFVRQFGIAPQEETNLMLPLVRPKHVKDDVLGDIIDAWRYVLNALGIMMGDDEILPLVDKCGNDLEDYVRSGDASDAGWRGFWLKALAGIVMTGKEIPFEPTLDGLHNLLSSRGVNLTFVVDGLEDWLQTAHINPVQQAAVRGLCVGAMEYLRMLPKRRIGLIAFLRKDIANVSVAHNFGQFFDVHESYALEWDRDEALRLVMWILKESKVVDDITELDSHVPLEMRMAGDLEQLLVPFWGQKLGSEKGKEAYTARWVLAALSDFHGRLQARDIIRFLLNASKGSLKDASFYSDRLLRAKAIKESIRPCGEDKIKEMVIEIPQLAQPFDKFKNARGDLRVVPFTPETFGLSEDDIRILMDSGVILEDNGKFYTPEVYRLGLGLHLARGARPRVLTLMRKALDLN